jgi:hypothetical protein
MGKNRDRESLIRKIVNTIVHEIVVRHTTRPESKDFLESEIIEYRGQVEKTSEKHSWNDTDMEYVKEKSLKKIKDKLKTKYSDIKYDIKEAEFLLDKEIKTLEKD